MPPKFLSDLEWHAMSSGGQIRKTIEDLRARVAALTQQVNDLRAVNRQLTSDLARRSNQPAAPPTQTSATQQNQEPEETKDLDDAAMRFGLLELD
jgi:predicted RNA-binding Zn ribbon-like protein